MTAEKPEEWPKWRIWWIASRPKTLTAAIAPVLVGIAAAVAEGGFMLLPALSALLTGLLIQIGTNLYNDYADFKRGADTAARLGPLRVTQAGLLPPPAVQRGALIAFGLAGGLGLYLIWHAGWVVALIGGTAILAGLAYTAGPWPLAYNGLADLFAWLFFGFAAVGGTAYVQLGYIPSQAWVGGLALGGLITALLTVNNIRDIEADRASGRKTIPVVFGRAGGMLEFNTCLLVSYLAPLLLIGSSWQTLWYLLPMLTVPEAIRLIHYIKVSEGKALNRALAWTARLVFWYGAMMALGILLA